MTDRSGSFFTNVNASSGPSLSYWGSSPENTPTADTGPYDFVSALAVVQDLELDLLHVPWQPAASAIGVGGTASVRQSPGDAQVDFAIKTFKGAEDIERMYQHLQKPYIQKAFQDFINEISIVRHPELRKHPNIIGVIGICFQIMAQGRVWPAMVLKRTAFGDLEGFATSLAGTAMSIRKRLSICIDTAIAIQQLHSCRIVHGDIKPQNILIDLETSGAYVPVIADFGYSSMFGFGSDLAVPIAKSEPWHAPEIGQSRRFTFQEAQSTDAYSFGMVCLWLLFHDSTSFPHSAGNEPPSRDSSVKALKEFRATGQDMLRLALQSTVNEPELEDDSKSMLSDFFTIILSEDGITRVQGLEHIVQWAKTRFSPASAVDDHTIEESKPEETQSALTMKSLLRNPMFSVTSSILQLYELDYRVRQFLCQSLVVITNDKLDGRSQDAGNELDVCRSFNVGNCESLRDGDHRPNAGSHTPPALQADLERIKNARLHFHPHVFLNLIDKGLVLDIEAEYYEDRGLLEDAYSVYKAELLVLGQIFGTESDIFIRLGQKHGRICIQLKRTEEAEVLYTRHVKLWNHRLGEGAEDDPVMIQECGNLALAISSQAGREAEAEELLLNLLKAIERSDLHKFANASRTMGNLALLYWRRGHFSEAAKYFEQAMKGYKDELGVGHPLTLRTVTNLATVYGELGRTRDLNSLFDGIVNNFEIQYGKDAKSTIVAITDIADVYERFELFDKSFEEYKSALERSQRVFGSESLLTLRIIAGSARICFRTGKRVEARKNIRRVLDWCQEQHELETPCESGAILGLLPYYRDEESPSNTEALCGFVLQGLERYLGPDHEWSRKVLHHLLTEYVSQRRLDEADTICNRLLFVKHESETSKKELEDVALSSATKLQLGLIYQERGRLNDAERVWKDTLLQLSKHSGPYSQNRISCLQYLALMYRSQRRDDEATTSFERALGVAVKSLGSKHLTTLEIKLGLSLHHLYRNRQVESYDLYSDVRKILEEDYIQNLETSRVLQNLAEIDRISRRHDQADTIYRRILPLFESECGSDHPDTLEIKHSVGLNMVIMGRSRDAEVLLREVLISKTKVLGQDHPKTTKLVNQLDIHFKQKGRYIEAMMMRKRFGKWATEPSDSSLFRWR